MRVMAHFVKLQKEDKIRFQIRLKINYDEMMACECSEKGESNW